MWFRLLFLVASATSSALPAWAAGDAPLRVVTLHTVLTEIAREVGGPDVTVIPLVGPGVDPHSFEPAPADLRRLHEADVVLAAGLSLESYLPRLTAELPSDRVIPVGDHLPNPLKNCRVEGAAHPAHAHDHDHRDDEIDPHWWHGLSQVMAATDLVSADFSRRRPDRAAAFTRGAQAYRARLRALQEWATVRVAEIPAPRRVLITSHGAFGYLAREHGFLVYPLLGLSTVEEADARQVAAIVRLIQQRQVKAVFAERSASPRLVDAVVRETGARLGGTLHADGLDDQAPTYEDLMRRNIETIVSALR